MKKIGTKFIEKKKLLITATVFAIAGAIFLLSAQAAPNSSVAEAEAGSLKSASIVSDNSASGGQFVNFEATPTTVDRYVGVYFSGGNDEASKTYFGKYPEISTTYYQPNEISKIVSRETERINRGTIPNLTITSKGTNHISGIADGNSASIAWIDSYVTAVKIVSDYAASKNMPVYVTLDHEWEVKVNQSILTGRDADPAVYGKALSIFFQKIRQNAPNATYIYWLGGFDTTDINKVMSSITVAPKILAADPYVNGNETDSASANWNSYIDRFRKSNGVLNAEYNRLKTLVPVNEGWEIKFAIPEHGIQTTDYVIDGVVKIATNHTNAQVAAYFTNLRQQMIDSDIVFSIFFNSDRDTPFAITPGATKYIPEAVTSFAQNL